MRCACIDIGSNTTRLLVAESAADGIREVISQRAFTRLRCGREPISAVKIGEVVAEVRSQVELARQAGAGRIDVVATAAIRRAPNRDELCAAIAAACGEEVAVLSGDEEARLAFAGATGTLGRAPAGVVGVVDVGGGSTELVCGTAAGGVAWWASSYVGSGALTEDHMRGDPPSAGELDDARRHIAEAFEGLDPPAVDVAYAVGGSATSLRRVLGEILDRDALAAGIAALTEAPAEDVARRLDLHVERVRVLPAGMLLLDAACALLDRPLRVAGGGLREGIVLERLAEARV